MSTPALFDFDARKDKTPAQIVHEFSDAAGKYEEVLLQSARYTQPLLVAKTVIDFFDEAKRSKVKILDVAAGTGLVAKHLWDKGFRKIDGLDPAEGMRSEAMKRGIYTNYYLEYMDGHHIDSILTDTYDCVPVAGGFNIGLIPCVGLLEMIRIVKPGGLICFGLHRSGLNYPEYKNRLWPLMSWLEEDGVLESLESINFNDLFATDLPGDILRFIVKASEIDVSIYVNKLKELS